METNHMRMKAHKLLLAFLLGSGFLTRDAPASTPAKGGEPKSYPVFGVVERVSAGEARATIHHNAIPDFMPEMTMDFNVKDTNQLRGIGPGAEVNFRLRVNDNDAWIEDLHLVRYSQKPVAAPTGTLGKVEPQLKPGDSWPDEELIGEDGKAIHFSDFRGKTVALTCFFTRCPLPDYCPRMNQNFSRARDLLATWPNDEANYRFLSISFDPQFDTPERLAAYGEQYSEADSAHWIFAVASTNTLARLAPRIGLVVQQQGASITHNLRTVVLDPAGRIYRQFDGNDWTARQLADAMKEAAQQTGTETSP